MKNQKQWINILIVAMTLATAWAIRGQFGHEQGAAWAGGIGALALVLVSKRKDWYNKMYTIALASAVGWGAGGMISYGVVVGYGNGNGFGNVWYGFLMLFVIGGLFGILGGGLVGLVLDSTEKKRVKWGSLFAEMTAGGITGYFLLVEQLGFLMTPPRSEAWSIILGAGAAMLWYMARNNHTAPLRVAFYTMIGGGFGFGFGNFLQVVLSNNAGFSFNWWNVMEYSIGFFGGIGLAYGVFSSEWPKESEAPAKWENRLAFLFVVVLIPLIIFRENFTYNSIIKRFGEIDNAENVAIISSIAAGITMLSVAIISGFRFRKVKSSFERKDVVVQLALYFGAYIVISYIISQMFAGHFLSNHHLYIVNFVVILVLAKKQFPSFFEIIISEINGKRWGFYLFGLLIIFAVLALIAINSHGEIGHHTRFPIN
jgi:hypothetical protein